MNILSDFLKKRGIGSAAELDEEEKVEFEEWRKILEKEEVEPKDLENFCQAQVGLIKTELEDLNRTPEKTERLTIMLVVYEKLLGVIQSPRKEREQLIKYLEEML